MVLKQRKEEETEWVNPKYQKEEDDQSFFEEEKDEAVLTDEEIAALQPIAEEAREEYHEYQEKKLEENIATKEALIGYKNKTFDLKVNVGDQILVFQVRRFSDKERSQLLGINYGLAQRAQMSMINGKALEDEEYQQIREDGYKLLAEVIIRPKMSVEEWKESVHTALLDKISTEIQKIQTEVDDVKLVDSYRKK